MLWARVKLQLLFRYPVKVFKNILDTRRLAIDVHNYNLRVMSNDNGFLGELNSTRPFDQRTLLARFRSASSANASSVFVPKPVYSLMGLLAMLGPQVLDIRSQPPVDLVATRETTDNYHSVSVMLSNNCSFNGTLALQMDKVKLKTPAVFAIWTLSQKWTNPRHSLLFSSP